MKKFYLVSLFLIFVSACFFGSNDTSSAITQAAEQGQPLSECSTDSLSEAANYADQNGYPDAANIIRNELANREQQLMNEAKLAESDAAEAIEDLVDTQKKIAEQQKKIEEIQKITDNKNDLSKNQDYQDALTRLQGLKTTENMQKAKVAEKADAMSKAYDKLADFYQDLQNAGDPVRIGTGRYVAEYIDFEAKDFGEKFTVERNLHCGNYSEGFGNNWTCSLASRIIRGSEYFDPQILKAYSTLIALYQAGIKRCEEYLTVWGGKFENAEILNDYIEFQYNKNYYTDKFNQSIEQLQNIQTKQSLNKYVSYGRYSKMSEDINQSGDLIYIDKKGFSYYFQYIEFGEWRAYSPITDSEIKIYSLNSEKRIDNSDICSGGYLVVQSDGTKRYFSNYGILEKETDRNGNETYYENRNGLITGVRLKTGEIINIFYNNNNQIVKIDGSISGSAYYEYEGNNLKSALDNNGILIKYEYDSDGDLSVVGKADDSSVRIFYEIDSSGRKVCSAVMDENDNVEYFYYFPESKTVIHRTSDGSDEVFKYDENGNVVYKNDCHGNELKLETDESGIIRFEEFNGTQFTYEYDRNFNLISKTDSNGNRSSFIYNKKGLLERTVDEDGFYTDYEYDDCGNVTCVRFCSNIVSLCTYYSNGLLKTLEENNCLYTYSYDVIGNLILKETEYVDHNHIKQKYYEEWEYDTSGRVVRYKDKYGQITEIQYGKKSMIELLPNNLKVQHIYNERRFEIETRKTDTETGITYTRRNVLDNKGNVKEVYLDGKLYAEYEYYPSGLLSCYCIWNIEKSDGKIAKHGIKTVYEYDSYGRIINVKRRLQIRKSSIYIPFIEDEIIVEKNRYTKTASGLIVQHYEDSINPTIYTYKNNGKLASIEKPDGYKKNFVYTRAGRILYEYDTNGNKYEYSYNKDGSRNIEWIIKNGIRCNYNYDQNDRLISYYDFTGRCTTFDYNFDGRLIRQYSENESYLYEYDEMNRLVSTEVYDSERKLIYRRNSYFDGNVTTTFIGDYISAIYKTDAFGRIQFQETAQGYCEYEYNVLGLVTKCKRGDGSEVLYEQNALGDLCFAEYGPDNSKLLIYDVDGKLRNTYKNGKRITVFEYNNLRQLISAENYLGNVKHFSYDEKGLIKSINNYDTGISVIKSENENICVFNMNGVEINSLQNLKSRSSANVRKNNLNLITYMQNGFEGSEYEYDKTFRLQGINDYGSGFETNYYYDSFGRMQAKVSELFEIEYSYDSCGRVDCIFENKTNTGCRIEYDRNNQETLLLYSDGTSLSITYNEIGQVQSRFLKNNSGTVLSGEMILYDDKNRISLKCNHKGELSKYEYDSTGKFIKEYFNYSDTQTEVYIDEFEKCGGIIDVEKISPETLYLENNEYELFRQICSFNNVSLAIPKSQVCWTIEYSYNPVGSVETEQSPVGLIMYEYDEYNRLIKKHASNTKDFGITYSWNKNDCLTMEKSQYYCITYEYEENVRPSKVHSIDYKSGNEKTIQYTYDALGRRYSECVNNVQMFIYSYDGMSTNVLGKIPVFNNGRKNLFMDLSVNYKDEYRTWNGELLEGDVRGFDITSENNTYTNKPEFYVYANGIPLYTVELDNSNADGFSIAINENWGENKSAWGSNSNFGYRDYNASMKCFTSSDPALDGGNYFAYCSTDPVNYIDMEGYKKTSLSDEAWARTISNLPGFMNYDPKEMLADGVWNTLDITFDCADTSAYLNWMAMMLADVDNMSPILKEFDRLIKEGKLQAARNLINSSSFFNDVFAESFTRIFAGFDRNFLANPENKSDPEYARQQMMREVAMWYLSNPNYLEPGTVLVWKSSQYDAKGDSGNWTGHTLTVLARKFDENGNVIGFAYLEGHQALDKLAELGFMDLIENPLTQKNDLDLWFGDFLGAYEMEGSDAHWNGMINSSCSK